MDHTGESPLGIDGNMCPLDLIDMYGVIMCNDGTGPNI